jgi:hypothetical protein
MADVVSENETAGWEEMKTCMTRFWFLSLI